MRVIEEYLETLRKEIYTAFRRVRKIAKSDYYFRNVWQSVWEKIGSDCTDFPEIMFLSIFQKSFEINSSFIKI